MEEIHRVREELSRELLNGNAIGVSLAKEVLERIRDRESEKKHHFDLSELPS
jgi:hypothetical protein